MESKKVFFRGSVIGIGPITPQKNWVETQTSETYWNEDIY